MVVKIRQFLFIIHLIILCSGENPESVILVSFDGMRHDYLEKADTPNFDSFIKKGVKAKSLIPVFPSYTFPNHYSIATGTYPGYHMITGNTFYDRKFEREYSLYDRSTVEDSRFYKGEPIWVTAEKQGIKTASFFWIGSEAPVAGYHPSIFKNYDGKIAFESRVDSVLSWLLLPEDQRPHLVMLYFSEPDKSGHLFGPDSKQTMEAVIKADRIFGRLLRGLKGHSLDPDIIVVSDHGMKNIDRDKVIVVDDFVNISDSLKVYGNGPLMQFDISFKSKIMRKNIISALSSIPNMLGYEKHYFPKKHHFINRNSGDFILVSEPGWLIFTRDQLKKTNMLKKDLKGMHGWLPEDDEMHGIFLAAGPQIRNGSNIASFENTAIYGIIADLLNLEPYSYEKYPDGARINKKINQSVLK